MSLEHDSRFQKRAGQTSAFRVTRVPLVGGAEWLGGGTVPHGPGVRPRSPAAAACGCQGRRARRSSQPVSPQAPAGGEQPAEARAARRRRAAGARHDQPLPEHVSPASPPSSSPPPGPEQRAAFLSCCPRGWEGIPPSDGHRGEGQKGSGAWEGLKGAAADGRVARRRPRRTKCGRICQRCPQGVRGAHGTAWGHVHEVTGPLQTGSWPLPGLTSEQLAHRCARLPLAAPSVLGHHMASTTPQLPAKATLHAARLGAKGPLGHRPRSPHLLISANLAVSDTVPSCPPTAPAQAPSLPPVVLEPAVSQL